jgi:hypothetical protein
LNSVSFPHSHVGTVVGDFGTILRTTDGGITWSPQVSGTTLDLNSVCFIDSSSGTAVGDGGTIIHTTDGGSGVWEEDQGRVQPLTSNLYLSVVPNPFTSFTALPGHETEHFSLYDISGRRVGTYQGGRIGEGLGAGVYFLRADKGNRKPIRIVKLR